MALSFAAGPDRVIFAEPGISTTASACTDGGDAVSCPYGPTVVFRMGDGDDSVTADGSIPLLATAAVSGEAGADRVAMGPGSDQIDGGPGADVMSGGGGFDTVHYGFTPRTTPVVAAIDGAPLSGNELDGLPGTGDTIATDIESLVGGIAADTLIGGEADDVLYGEFITAIGGADVLLGHGGNDKLNGGPGRDRLLGEDGDDILTGDAGGDRLLGGAGLDKLLAKDRDKDKVLDCGPGKNRRERAIRDPIDPRGRRC